MEVSVDNMAHLGFIINPVSRENNTTKPIKQNNSNNKREEVRSNVRKDPKFYLFECARYCGNLEWERVLAWGWGYGIRP